jgi:serine/threonine protein kinase
MNDMVRTRGRCLDEEARFYMVQLLAGCQYMHNNHVIHRDLKLGNIMLDVNMNIKIGDFGLAALLKDPEERKKTMCGTPNYIAPEILYEGNGAGHSFEVDVWSVGVILYTLLIGKPPFQTTSVPAIYEKIRKNDYSIPEYIHPAATDLIKQILTPDPSARPTLVYLCTHSPLHPFHGYKDGPTPYSTADGSRVSKKPSASQGDVWMER